ncbi:aminoacyl-tRNA hydrolase [candidate division KSB1 bacterium]|nr:aminoacyl-tRNA hydrolase [candidate division KSB1 bacterium]
MCLIIGLGNPGIKYSNTRHNLGFMTLDVLATRHGWSFQNDRLYSIATGKLNNKKILLIKPKTYMNKSGLAVIHALQYYKLSLESSLTVCDDINIPFGTIRIRANGSHGGQNGLRSIIEQLQSREFPRMRLGIGDDFRDASNYVLSPFRTDEKKLLPDILECAADAIECFVGNGIELTMSRFNRSILTK